MTRNELLYQIDNALEPDAKRYFDMLVNGEYDDAACNKPVASVNTSISAAAHDVERLREKRQKGD